MKKVLLIAILSVAGLCFFASKAQAQFVYAWPDEKLATVIDLPNDDNFYHESEKGYINLGYYYKQVWIMWIPIWNYDGQYCLLVEGKKDYYISLTPEEVEGFKGYLEENGIEVPSGDPTPFWDKIGGKLVWLLVIAFLIWSSSNKAKKKKEEANVETENTTQS